MCSPIMNYCVYTIPACFRRRIANIENRNETAATGSSVPIYIYMYCIIYLHKV